MPGRSSTANNTSHGKGADGEKVREFELLLNRQREQALVIKSTEERVHTLEEQLKKAHVDLEEAKSALTTILRHVQQFPWTDKGHQNYGANNHNNVDQHNTLVTKGHHCHREDSLGHSQSQNQNRSYSSIPMLSAEPSCSSTSTSTTTSGSGSSPTTSCVNGGIFDAFGVAKDEHKKKGGKRVKVKVNVKVNGHGSKRRMKNIMTRCKQLEESRELFEKYIVATQIHDQAPDYKSLYSRILLGGKTHYICKAVHSGKTRQCGMIRKAPSMILYHLQRSSGIFPFRCKVCPDSGPFQTKWDATKHVKHCQRHKSRIMVNAPGQSSNVIPVVQNGEKLADQLNGGQDQGQGQSPGPNLENLLLNRRLPRTVGHQNGTKRKGQPGTAPKKRVSVTSSGIRPRNHKRLFGYRKRKRKRPEEGQPTLENGGAATPGPETKRRRVHEGQEGVNSEFTKYIERISKEPVDYASLYTCIQDEDNRRRYVCQAKCYARGRGRRGLLRGANATCGCVTSSSSQMLSHLRLTMRLVTFRCKLCPELQPFSNKVVAKRHLSQANHLKRLSDLQGSTSSPGHEVNSSSNAAPETTRTTRTRKTAEKRAGKENVGSTPETEQPQNSQENTRQTPEIGPGQFETVDPQPPGQPTPQPEDSRPTRLGRRSRSRVAEEPPNVVRFNENLTKVKIESDYTPVKVEPVDEETPQMDISNSNPDPNLAINSNSNPSSSSRRNSSAASGSGPNSVSRKSRRRLNTPTSSTSISERLPTINQRRKDRVFRKENLLPSLTQDSRDPTIGGLIPCPSCDKKFKSLEKMATHSNNRHKLPRVIVKRLKAYRVSP